MTKLLIILALILSALGVGYFVYQLTVSPLVSDSSTPSAVLQLVNLPARYCPKNAQVVTLAGAEVVADSQLPVTNCNQLNLGRQVGIKGVGKLVIKLPEALAFSLSWPVAQSQLFSYAPALGDVNADNIIDGVDAQTVTAALFTKSRLSPKDIDGDGTITIADLTLVRLNQGVGVVRPDNRAWGL